MGRLCGEPECRQDSLQITVRDSEKNEELGDPNCVAQNATNIFGLRYCVAAARYSDDWQKSIEEAKTHHTRL